MKPTHSIQNTVIGLLLLINIAAISFYFGKRSVPSYEKRNVDQEIQFTRSGVSLLSFQALDLEGKTIDIRYNQKAKPKVFYVLSVNCNACSKNWEYLNNLHGKFSETVEFYVLSTNDSLDTSNYSNIHKTSIPVLHSIPSTVWKNYFLTSYPQIIIASNQSVIIKNWRGVLTDSDKLEINIILMNLTKHFKV